MSVQSSRLSRGVSAQSIEGDKFLAVGTGDSYFVPSVFDTQDITVSQSFQLNQGDVVSGWFSFFNGDYIPQDSAWVKVLDASGREMEMPAYEVSGTYPASSVDYLSATPWTHWQWTAPAVDTYVLTLGVTTFGDNRYSSYGLYDAIEIAHVPDTGSTWLFAVTLIGVIWLGRKRLAG